MRQVAQSFVEVDDVGERVGRDLELDVFDPVLLAQIAVSSSSIAREAFEMSVSSAQKRSKPPPVPEIPTVTSPPPAAFQSSAALVVKGPTVLEPSAVITPLVEESAPPHPAAASASCAHAGDHRQKGAHAHAASVLGAFFAPGCPW